VLPCLQGARWQSDARLRMIELPKTESRRIALVQPRDSAQAPVIAALVREFRARL